MGLRARWTLALMAVALSLVLIVTGGLELARRQVSRDTLRTWEQERRALTVAALRDRGRAAGVALRELVDTGGFATVAADAARGGPEVRRALADWAGAAASRLAVHEILLLDGEGRVLSSARWRAGAGRIHPRADDLLGALPSARLVFDASPPGAGAPDWTVGAMAVAPGPGGDLRLIVGLDLGPDVLERWRDELELDALRWGAPSPARGESRFELPADWQPGEGAFLTWDPGRPAAARALDGLRIWILVAGVGGLVVAALAAPAVAAGLGRPLESMASAVGAIGRGARHPDLPEGGPREVRQLGAALRQLTRDLDEAEERIRGAERRAAWREIARRIAHEIRNALSPLSLAVDNVETAATRDDPAARAALSASLRTARDQLQSLQRLVEEFRDFARQPRLAVAPVDVADLLDAALGAARAAQPDAVFEVDVEAAPESAYADAEQLRRALHNVLKNAAEAAPDATVVLASGVGDDPRWWWIEVRDRGPGLAPEVADRLGDPYVTTKADGTGLGLPVTLRIVEAHGGRLDVRARDGGGLVVRIDLPRRAPESPPEETRS